MRPWIKLHTTMLDDVRLLRLNERQHLRYYQLYLLAGRLNADGLFVENNARLDDLDIAIKLRVSDRKQFAADFAALKKAGLVKQNGHGPYIEAFAREQVDWSKKQEQDRERKQKQRHADVTRDENVTEKKSRKRHSDVTPLDQTKTKKEIKKETKKKKEIKPPTPKPPASKHTAASGGGGKKNSSSPSAQENKPEWLANMKGDERTTAEIMLPILTLSGVGTKKIETLLPKVTTRIKPPEAKRYVLAALASVYADADIRNKPIVAVHRMENDSVPVIFMNSHTWRRIPADILKAADIDIDRLPRETSQINTSSRDAVISKVASNVS